MDTIVICVKPKKGEIRLNIVGSALIVLGIIFLIYSIMSKNKVNIYNRRNNLIVINKHKFLKLQLYFSIFTSVCVIAWGLIIGLYNLPNIYILLSPLLFPFMNSIINPISRIKGYIKYD